MATVPTWLGTLLFGVRHVLTGGASVNDADTINFIGFTVAYDSVNKKIDIVQGGAGVPATFGAITVSSLTIGSQAPPQFTQTTYPSQTTVAGETINLGSPIPVASGAVSLYRLIALANISPPGASTTKGALACSFSQLVGRIGAGAPAGSGFPGVNAAETRVAPPFISSQFGQSSRAITATVTNNGSGLVRVPVATSGLVSGDTVVISGVTGAGAASVNETWPIAVVDSTHVDLIGSTYTAATTGFGTVAPNGFLSVIASGVVAVQTTAAGITPARWSSGEILGGGEVRYAVVSGNTYICSQGGTTASSPTGSGVGIVDGTAKWDLLVASARQCPVSWTLASVRVFSG